MSLKGGVNKVKIPGQKLPNKAVCRAQKLVIVDLYKCLVKKPQGCEHATFFGGGVFCHNLKREAIAARTQSFSAPPRARLSA
jgi:hypothetical protein